MKEVKEVEEVEEVKEVIGGTCATKVAPHSHHARLQYMPVVKQLPDSALQVVVPPFVSRKHQGWLSRKKMEKDLLAHRPLDQYRAGDMVGVGWYVTSSSPRNFFFPTLKIPRWARCEK